MEQWTRPRKCVACGNTFTLAQHGTAEAQQAARQLTEGVVDNATLPRLVTRCPVCNGTTGPRVAGAATAGSPAPAAQAAAGLPSAAIEEAAIAAALAEGMRIQRDEEAYYLPYAKRIGLFVVVLSLLSLMMVLTYARLRGGAYGFWSIVCVAAAAGGFALFAWAKSRLNDGGLD